MPAKPPSVAPHRKVLYLALGLALIATGFPASAWAQGWDPFSQLDTDRWERRSKPDPSARGASTQRPPPDSYQPQPDPGPGTAPAYGTADPRGDYLDPPDRRPRFSDTQTYYPPPRADLPASGPRPTPQGAPSSISAEPLAPLSGPAAPDQYGQGLPGSTVDRYPGAPPDTSAPQPWQPGAPRELAVRQEFPPGMANATPSVPHDFWRGMDMAAVERDFATLDIPPRSPELHALWRRLIVADVAPPAGAESQHHFQALRLEALYRTGLLGDIREWLNANRAAASNPLIAMFEARSEIGLGHREAGCEAVRRIDNIRGEIPKTLRGEAILVSGYCAAATGNKPAAGLLAELAREEGLKPSPGLAALDAVALGVKTDLSLARDQRLSLIDYRILELGGATPEPDDLIKVASPALLAALAGDSAANPDLRLAAAEAAARINALPPDALAALYRQAAGRMSMAEAPVPSTSNGSDTPKRRALLYASAESEHTPFKKVRFIRAFIDSAKRASLYLPALIVAAKLTDQLGLVPEIGWFAETAIEANLAAGNYESARKWTKFASSIGADRNQNVDHWLALIDIADPHFPGRRGDSLAQLERLALMGRFTSDSLHRLATVLNALEYNVPIPLWEAASRTPQPTAGHLPQTGVLSELQDAAKKHEFARTVLLAMRTLGPDGADGAHMIALGDSIRALKRAGLEPDARRLGFEALLAGWPRMVTN